MERRPIATVALALAVLWVGTARAASDEEKCLAGRAKAKGRYEKCVQDQLGKAYGTSLANYTNVLEKLANCRIKYAGAWTKLQALTGSATCGLQPRYVDNLDGTITDNLSGLVWEKKSDNGDVHDQDSSSRMWSTGAPYNGNGTTFTTFLRDGLNAGAGFAGANDWRLPTFAELQTILLAQPYPCTVSPCIDAAFNSGCVATCTVLTCSCTQPGFYWSATTYAGLPDRVWFVYFFDGYVFDDLKTNFNHARAVRGGL